LISAACSSALTLRFKEEDDEKNKHIKMSCRNRRPPGRAAARFGAAG
jgi:hypothetical protein